MEATEEEDAPAAEPEPSSLQLRPPVLSRRASAEIFRLSQCSITLATFLRASACSSSSPSCAWWQLHRGHNVRAQHSLLFHGCHTHCSCGRTCRKQRQCSGASNAGTPSGGHRDSCNNSQGQRQQNLPLLLAGVADV